MNLNEMWNSFLAISRKEIHRVLKIWPQTILPPLITSSLYFVIFGKLIGSQIQDVEGFTYMQFITPGLIMMSMIINSYMNVCSSFYISKFQRSVEELLISPTPNFIIIWGYGIGGIFRAVLIGTAVLSVALAFTQLPIINIGVLILFALLTAILFSLAGMVNAVLAKKFDDISIIPTFVLTPLTYLGGVFYSLEQLPEFWRNVSYFNPVVYMISGFRYGFTGTSVIPLSVSFGLLVGFIVLLYIICLGFLRKGVGLKS